MSNQTQYKSTGKPSDKQIIFAKAIAKGLNINEPNFNSLVETKDFIEKNKDAYYKGSTYNQMGALVEKIQYIKDKYSIVFDSSCITPELISNEIQKIIVLWDNDKLVDIRYEEFSKFQDFCIEECFSKKGIINFNYISIIPFNTYIDGEIAFKLLRSEYLNDNEQEIAILYKSNINIDELMKFEFIKRSNNLQKEKEYVSSYDPTWNKKYQDYLTTKEWKEISANLKGIMKKCLCFDSTSNLVVHHLRYDNVDFNSVGSESLEDIMVICGNCHDKIYSGTEINLDKYEIPKSNLKLRDLTNMNNVLEIAKFVSGIMKK